MIEWWVITGGITTAAISVIASIVAGRRGADKEWERVAAARGAEINDLRVEVAELKLELSNIKGQMQALQALKAAEIAQEVVSVIVPLLKKVQGNTQ